VPWGATHVAKFAEARAMNIVLPQEQVDFAHNKLLLNRYRFVEY